VRQGDGGGACGVIVIGDPIGEWGARRAKGKSGTNRDGSRKFGTRAAGDSWVDGRKSGNLGDDDEQVGSNM
jgi:hypothetical protein